ncbi:MAG TPA: hypothetical protein VE819_12445 [Steroidobacteraceae bacterium]|nr:hypothetical protein [Steroidobacteraceae bacterium]
MTRVDFAPAVTAKLQDYGESEGATVRDAIVRALARASQPQVPPGLSVGVTVLDLAPSRLTRKQLNDDSSLDVVSSKSLGGAELEGEVRDAQQHLLMTVSYRYFAPDITAGSPAHDPWADARVAIPGFAAKLTAAVRGLPSEPASTRAVTAPC